MVRFIIPAVLELAMFLIFVICMFVGGLTSHGVASGTLTGMKSDVWEPCSSATSRETDSIVQSGSSRVVTWWLCQYPVWRP